MSDAEVRATVPQPYWPLWGVHADGETEHSMWAALPCESIALTRSGGLILLPGQDFRVTLERGGNAKLDARDDEVIVSSTGRVDLRPIELWALEQAIDNVRRAIAWTRVGSMKARLHPSP